MYNGVGLTTARGSGTNAYVQKNLSFINKVKPKVEYKSEEDIKRLEASVNRPANQEILAHQRKRQIELKCLEMREKMEEQSYPEEEIETKLISYRETITKKAEEDARQKELFMKFDNNGRPFVKETHQMAEMNQERNDKLRNALKIRSDFVEGSSLDPERRSKDSKNNQDKLTLEKYPILKTPSPELSPEPSPELSPKAVPSRVSVVERKPEINNETVKPQKPTETTEKHKEQKNEKQTRDTEVDTSRKEIPKKYAYDERKRRRSRSSSKSRDGRKSYSGERSKKSHSSKTRSHERKRGRNESDSSRSSRERHRRRSKAKSRSSSSASSKSSSSSSSTSSSSSRSSSSSSSNSSRSKSRTRSPPIRRRRGSPNFLEKRRITRY